MAELYIGFVDTPGFFASIIRRTLKQKYVHVVIASDPYLTEAYSIGRRNPAIPIFAGFEKEDKEKILRTFPGAEYMVSRFECTDEQKAYVEHELRSMYQKRFHIHYAVIGLPFILINKAFQQKNHYTCSSYIAKLLADAGIIKWDKDTSLVTPKDFLLREDKVTVFEGSLEELIAIESYVTGKETERTNLLSGEVIYGQ